MQSNVVKAFRQRLIRNGFKDVFILNHLDGTYTVSCISNTGERIMRQMTELDMCCVPRLVWFE